MKAFSVNLVRSVFKRSFFLFPAPTEIFMVGLVSSVEIRPQKTFLFATKMKMHSGNVTLLCMIAHTMFKVFKMSKVS